MTVTKNLGTFGIEYEVMGIGTYALDRYVNTHFEDNGLIGYRVVSDGSVDAELPSPILNWGRIWEVEKVTSLLKDAGANVRGTSTGLHVHIGANEWGLNTANKREIFARNFWVLLPQLKRLVSPSRNNNRFARDMSPILFDRYIDAVRTMNGGADTRYYALNANSLAEHGTFEIRLHQGSLNAAKINSWVGLLSGLALLGQNSLTVDANDEDYADINSTLKTLRRYGFLNQSHYLYLKSRASVLSAR